MQRKMDMKLQVSVMAKYMLFKKVHVLYFSVSLIIVVTRTESKRQT